MFILRAGKGEFQTGEDVRATWPAIRKEVGRNGVFVTTEATGRYDRSKLRLMVLDEERCRNKYGNKTSVTRRVVANTAAGVKSVLRRIRPEELERIEAKDTEIAEAKETLKRLQYERADIVQEAWTKAHVVRLNELEPTEGY